MTKGWAALALVTLVGGRAYALTPQVEVASAPIHAIPDADDQAAGPADAPAKVQEDRTSAPAARETPSRPSVALAHQVIDAAGAFDVYMKSAAAIDAKFDDGPSVARAVSVGAAYEPHQLQGGAIAYAALVALQDPAFVQAVSDAGESPAARSAFVERLLQDPSAVLQAPAARTAAARVAGVLGRMGGRLLTSGQAVKQSAYDVQHQAWSKGPIVAPEQRLAHVKAQSAAFFTLSADDAPRLMYAVTRWREADATAPDSSYTATPVVTHGLALAALAVLGEAGEDNAGRLVSLMTDPTSAQCVKMAKLNLFQCLAVAGPHYEDLFCLGRHAMMDTGQCVVTAAGWTPSDDAAAPRVAPAIPARSMVAQNSVLVPVAFTSGSEERDSVFGPQPAAAAEPGVAEAGAAGPF